MKYVISWTRKNLSEAEAAKSLAVFSKWSPDSGVKFIEFLGRIDNNGGFAVVETDNPTLIARDLALFSAFNDFEIFPVLEIAETAQYSAEALATLDSIS